MESKRCLAKIPDSVTDTVFHVNAGTDRKRKRAHKALFFTTFPVGNQFLL